MDSTTPLYTDVTEDSLNQRDEFLGTAARLAGVSLALGGGLALLVFLYFLYRYSLTGEWHFTSPGAWVSHYLLPLALAAYFFASLRFTPAHRVRVFIVAATFVASVYSQEALFEWYFGSGSTVPVMMRLQTSHDKAEEAARLSQQWGIEIDARAADTVVAGLRSNGLDAVRIAERWLHPDRAFAAERH